MNITTFEMPGISDKFNTANSVDGFAVKYFKADLDDLESLSMLQDIETRGLRGEEVVLLEKDKFTFMEKYFIILKYMERR